MLVADFVPRHPVLAQRCAASVGDRPCLVCCCVPGAHLLLQVHTCPEALAYFGRLLDHLQSVCQLEQVLCWRQLQQFLDLFARLQPEAVARSVMHLAIAGGSHCCLRRSSGCLSGALLQTEESVLQLCSTVACSTALSARQMCSCSPKLVHGLSQPWPLTLQMVPDVHVL